MKLEISSWLEVHVGSREPFQLPPGEYQVIDPRHLPFGTVVGVFDYGAFGDSIMLVISREEKASALVRLENHHYVIHSPVLGFMAIERRGLDPDYIDCPKIRSGGWNL